MPKLDCGRSFQNGQRIHPYGIFIELSQFDSPPDQRNRFALISANTACETRKLVF